VKCVLCVSVPLNSPNYGALPHSATCEFRTGNDRSLPPVPLEIILDCSKHDSIYSIYVQHIEKLLLLNYLLVLTSDLRFLGFFYTKKYLQEIDDDTI
jgi:hypothetical protein